MTDFHTAMRAAGWLPVRSLLFGIVAWRHGNGTEIAQSVAIEHWRMYESTPPLF